MPLINSLPLRLSRRRFVHALGLCGAGARLHLWAEQAETNAGPIENSRTVSPRSILKLFNGRDLTGFYPWLAPTGYADPKQVFSVLDGVLRVSGEVPGYLGTRESYANYHLIAEYKWGRETYGSKTVRNSGILLHATGPDGNDSPWTASIECQVAQGCVGDFIVIRGKDAKGNVIPVTLTSDTIMGPDGHTRWKRGGKPTPYGGKQFWWSLHEPGFEEKIDTRGKNDPDSPLGEWTRLECICKEDRITAIVNGTVVNECYKVWPTGGRILLESEGSEILFRKVELHPLGKG